MAVKCILTGQTPSVLDGVTENVQTQLNDKVDKVTGKGLSTNDYTSAEKTKLSGIETGAQKNTITGVKGSAETTYRTGNVNITATNIGLGNVDNTSDANKPISNATQAALNDKQSKITANGILKGNGTGGVSAAVKGTDYFTPADVNEIAAEAAKKVDISDKVSKSGDTMTGKLTVPQVETGADNSNFFQCRKFRGEGDANTYYHAIDFGYANHDKVDFHEYGGIWNFFKNTSGKANDGVLCGKITSNGWEGRAKLESGSTMVTSQLTENSDAIATTAFVHGLVDNVKHYSASNPPPYPVTSVNGQTGAVTLAKGDVGLGNVDNTSDANKPISNATQVALNNKQAKITATGILKGDGKGNITAADSIDLPTEHISNISLPTASWKGSDPYTQTVTISGSTANTKVDIQFSEEIYDQLVADNVGYLAIKNVNGTLIAVAKGGKPSVNLTVQVTYNNVYQ